MTPPHIHTMPDLSPYSWTLIVFQSHRRDQSTNEEGASPRLQGSCSRAPQEQPTCSVTTSLFNPKSIIAPLPSPAVILRVPQCWANAIRVH